MACGSPNSWNARSNTTKAYFSSVVDSASQARRYRPGRADDCDLVATVRAASLRSARGSIPYSFAESMSESTGKSV
jgi:hypothetical protein